MALAIQFLRITLFAVFSNLATNGIGIWDGDTGAFTLHVDSVLTLLAGGGGFLATLGWWRWANKAEAGR